MSLWEIAALVVAAWFLLRVTRGRQCGGKRGIARRVFVVGAVVVGGMVMSRLFLHQQGQVVPRDVAARVGPHRSVHFGKQASNSDFARIDADEMNEYRAQVSRRARMTATSSDAAEAAAPATEAKPSTLAAPLPPEIPESPQPAPAVPAAPAASSQPLPAEAPQAEAPAAAPTPASPKAQAPSQPAVKSAAKTAKVQFDAGPLRVEIDTDEESGLPSSEEIGRAVTTVAAHAVVEAVKHLTRASANAAKRTAAQLTSGSKKPGSKSDTATTEKTHPAATPEAPDAVASDSTSNGAFGSTGNASYVAESVSTSSHNDGPAAHAEADDGTVQQAVVSAPKRPAWVDEPLGKQGSLYRTKVVVGPYKTRQECDAEIPSEVLQAARSVIDRQIGASNRISNSSLQPYVFSSRILKEEWEEHRESDTAAVGEMIYLHALLEFDDRSWRELARMQHQREIEERVARVGIGAGLLLTLLGTVFGYLKLDTMTRGYYTRRLQLAAGAVILGIAALVASLIG